MRKILKLCLKSLVVVLLMIRSVGAVTIGDSKDQVIAELGKPTGQLTGGDEEILLFSGLTVYLQDNAVKRIEELTKHTPKQTAAGLSPSGEDKSSSATPAYQKTGMPKLRIVGQSGRRIDLEDVLVKGHITIVDFYADWCGPCRQIAPYLEKLTQDNPDVYLRKIDIVNWGSPVSQQYDIRSVPNIRVYAPDGTQIGTATHNFQQVIDYIKKARR